MLVPFFLALSATLFTSIFFPKLHLMTFAPFLALVYMRKTFLTALWLSAFAGLILDLTSSQMGFGLNALTYTAITILLYKQRSNFFSDRASALFLYTVLISAISSFLLILLQGIPLTPFLVLSDLCLMPILDGGYAFLWFTCPLKLCNDQ